MNLREEFILRAGAAALPGFRERAAAFGGRSADQLALFNGILSAARAALPEFDKACSAAGIGRDGCGSTAEIGKVPLLPREAMAAGRNRTNGLSLAKLESGGTGRTGRLETALDKAGVLARYADLLAVLKGTSWRMGERVSALHPVEYGYFQTFRKTLKDGALGKLVFGFVQQYALYRIVHNRRNIHYAGDVFSSAEAARSLLERAMADDPVLLITRPDALMAILKAARPGDGFRRLRAVLTVGTALGAPVRAAAREKFGAEVFDMYASTELGYVGLTCPLSGGRFHINSPAYLVETGPGGAVIVTDFGNLLMPMVRYDTGDHGVLSEGPCACGRPGPLLRVTGRRAGVIKDAAGRELRETDIIDLVFPAGLPFFQLYRDAGGRTRMRLPESETGREEERAGRAAALLGLPETPKAEARGLSLPPSGKFCYLT